MNYQNLSKGLSTASGAAPVVLGDIQNMYKAYNPVFEGNPYQNFNVGANYNQLLNQDPEYMSNNIQSVGAGKMFLNSQKNALEGASAFSSLGPWGMLGGAIGGTVMSIGTDLLNNTVGKQRQQQRVDLYNKDLRTRYDTALATSLDMAREQQVRNRTVQPFAVGGDLSTQAPGEYNEFNVGGSHQENPFGGIPQGIGANGQQNVVEEGEVKFNDYIYTNRISLADNVRDQFNIPIKYSRKSYADIAKSLQEESKERPNDPISQKGMQAMMSRLKDAQEYQKLEEAAAEEDMSIEEYMAYTQQQNSFAYGGNLDTPKDPPIVFDPNALRNSDPKLQPQYTQVDNTNTVQRQNVQNVTPIKVKKQFPTYQVEIPTIAIPQQTVTPQDNTRTTQSYGISPEEVSVIQNRNFLEKFVQTAPTTPEMYQQELAQLHPEDRAVAEAVGYETIADARQNWMDATQGSITPGRDYNKVQEWWRNYTSTAKGQELVKFINNPQLNMMAAGLNPTAMVGMMGADWANQYGQGASTEELGKTVATDLATMMLLGRIQGGNKMNLLPENTAFQNNPFPIRSAAKAATQMSTRGNPIEPINVKFPKPNLNPKTNLLGTPGTKYVNLGNKSYPYKDNWVSKGIKASVPIGLISAFIDEGINIPRNIEAEKQYIKQQDINNEVGLLRDNLDAFYRTAGRATEEDVIINQEALESIYLFKDSYKTYKDSLTAGDLELLKAIGIDLETDK